MAYSCTLYGESLQPLLLTQSGSVPLQFTNFTNVTFTSGVGVPSCEGTSCVGTFEGRGQKWWGIPGLGYLKRTENRPRECAQPHQRALPSPLAHTARQPPSPCMALIILPAPPHAACTHRSLTPLACTATHWMPPGMFNVNGKDLLFENHYYHEAPYWTHSSGGSNIEIRHAKQPMITL